MSTTYLITGGAGFIGSHLTEALLERGDTVTVLDDLSTGSWANLLEVAANPRLTFVMGSVLDELIVDELVHQADVVVHLAAAVGVNLILDHPLRSFTTNIRGSEIVITAAHRYRRKILVASTSEIYGKNTSDSLAETADRVLGSPAVSRWSYSTAKAVDEILALSYHRERGLQSIVARFFNTVGPRQSPAYGMVIPRLMRQAVNGDPLTVYGDGEQTRCFCHVADTVAAVVGLLDHPDTIGEVYNIGGVGEVSMLDLAGRVKAVASSEAPIELVPYEVAFSSGYEDMRRRVPDTTKINRLLGWAPQRSFDEILAQALDDARADQHLVNVENGATTIDLTDSARRASVRVGR